MKRCILAAFALAASVSAGNDRDYDRGHNNNDNGSASAFGIGALAGIGAGIVNGATGTAAGIGAGLGLGIGGINVGNGNGNYHGGNSNSNSGGNNHSGSGTSLSGIGIGAGIGIGIGGIHTGNGNGNQDCPDGQTFKYGKCRCPDGTEWTGDECVPISGNIVCNGGTVKGNQCVCEGEFNVPVKDEGLKNCYTCKPKCANGDWGGGWAIPTGLNADQCQCNTDTTGNVPVFDADECRYQCLEQCINEPPSGGVPRPPSPCKCVPEDTAVQIGDNRWECKPRCEGGDIIPQNVLCPSEEERPFGGPNQCCCPVGTKVFLVEGQNRYICVDICKGGKAGEGLNDSSTCQCFNGKINVENADYPGTFTCQCPPGKKFIGNTCVAPNKCAGLACHPVGSSGICPENMRRVGDDCECPNDCEWRDNKCHRRGNSVVDSGRGSDSRRGNDSSSNRNHNNGGLNLAGIGIGAGLGLGVISASQNEGRRDYAHSAGHVHNTMQVPPSVPHLFDPMTGQPISAPAAPSAPITAPSAPAPVSPVGPTGSATAACAAGFKQCTLAQPEGPTTYCYNPQVYACVKVASGSSLICPANANAACGNGCYDPTQFACKDGVVVAF